MPYELPDDLALAEEAVRTGASAAAAERAAGEVAYKASAGDPVVSADRVAERAIVGLLRSRRPDDGLLGEEGADVSGPSRRWLIDGWTAPRTSCSACRTGAPRWRWRTARGRRSRPSTTRCATSSSARRGARGRA
jgi:3'-phosphoadenosine 5'-phosphosulfate (PAPS) 3'-phosphatase